MLLTGLSYPQGVAVDSTGTVYVADGQGNRVLKLAAGRVHRDRVALPNGFSNEPSRYQQSYGCGRGCR